MPVVDRLRDCMEQAIAYAAAIADNAQDNGKPLPAELVASFQADCHKLIVHLTTATTINEIHHLPVGS